MGKLYNHIMAFLFSIFLCSGMIKWIPFPIDFALLSSSLLVVGLLVKIIYEKKISIILNNRLIIIFILLISWATISLLYSSSNEQSIKKILQFYLCLIGLFVGVSSNNNSFVNLFFLYNRIFVIICLLILTFAYVNLGYSLNSYIYFASSSKEGFPNYLVLSGYLVMNFFLIYNKNKIPFLLLKLWILFILVNLGGRGPIIFLSLITIFDIFIFSINLKKSLLILVIIVVSSLTVGLIINSFKSNRAIQRFLLLGSSNDRSSRERINLLNKSVFLYSKNPILGIGIGAFGNEIYDKEIREYPHSMFFEVLCELGLLGFILFAALMINLIAMMINFFRKFNRVDPKVKGITYSLLFLILESQKSGSIFENRVLFSFIGIFLSINYLLINERNKLLVNDEKQPENN